MDNIVTIYVLNFSDHSFTMHDFVDDAGETVEELLNNGVSDNEIEVVFCCDNNGNHMKGIEFLHKWCE